MKLLNLITLKKYILCGYDKLIKVISSTPFESPTGPVIETEEPVELNQIFTPPNERIRLAYICNWGQKCGISTYSKYVRDALKFKVDHLKVFSEHAQKGATEDSDYIQYCWRRGEPLNNLIDQLKNYNPDVILIQHEWGIFPNPAYFMGFIMALKQLNIPVVVVLHSIYKHLDKQLPLSVIDNVIVHSNEAKFTLIHTGYSGNVTVIPHGCPAINTQAPVYNIFKNPYLLFGYGFGFKYKGVEMAIEAIKFLKDTDSRYKDILYIYACSESENNKGIHDNYYNLLSEKVKAMGLETNVLLVKGFLEPTMLDIYLRTVKMALFTYVTEPSGVYGASGAIKIAMSYNLPVIASQSHLFDDIAGYVPRAANYKDLADNIDKLFIDRATRDKQINKQREYIKFNSWDKVTDRYVDVIKAVK